MGSGQAGDGRRWDDLAVQVKRRREAMRLAQNLTARGGPGEITVRKIERGDGATAQPRTWARLEQALSAPDGWVDRVLDGTATPEDLDPNHRVVRAGAVHASLGGLAASAKGTSANDAVPVTDTADAVAHTEAEVTRAHDEMSADLAGSVVLARMSDAAVYAVALQRAVQRSGEPPFDDLARALIAALQVLQDG